MAAILTARTVAFAKPPATGQYDLWDRQVPGFGLRVSYGGRKAWVVRYRTKGHVLRRMTIGIFPRLSLADARGQARKILRAAELGQDPAAVKKAGRQAESFEDLGKEYIKRHAKVKKRSWREDQRMIDNELAGWKKTKLPNVTRQEVRRLVERIAARPAPIHANRVLALIRKMMNFALANDWIEVNPALKIQPPGEERQRDRVLDDDELRAAWKAFEKQPPLLAAYCKLRLLTAQRGGEVRQMRWENLDLEQQWWTIPPDVAKNGLTHRVSLAESAVTVLKGIQSLTGAKPWVFPSSTTEGPMVEVKKVIRTVRTDAKIEFRGHDLRRTAATRMASAGVSRLVIAKVLNHAEQGVTAVYDRHSYDLEKRAALEAWATELERILADDKVRVGTFARRA